ncbi:MAG: hypothetical protein ACRCZP_02540 [Phycicoccus sp.]
MPVFAGQIITAAMLNEIADPPTAHLLQTLTLSVPNATWTSVPLDVEIVDSANGHSTTINPSRYVCQRAGVYEFGGALSFTINATGIRSGRVLRNGSAAVLGSVDLRSASSADFTCMSLPISKERLSIGDYVELQAYQTSGASLNLDDTVNGAGSALSITYIGP